MSEIDPVLLQQKQEILDEMIHFMTYGAADDKDDEEYDPEFDAGYTQNDVDKCDELLTTFLQSVGNRRGADRKVLRAEVKTLVLALNELNEECDWGIIETGEREGICLLIDAALKQAGMTPKGDITLEWREW